MKSSISRFRSQGRRRCTGKMAFEGPDMRRDTVFRIAFVEEGRFVKDDFGNWRVSYNYDAHGPKWRLSATAVELRRSGGAAR